MTEEPISTRIGERRAEKMLDEFEACVDAMYVVVKVETKNKIMVQLTEAYGPMTFRYIYLLGKPGRRPWGGRVIKNDNDTMSLGKSELKWIFSVIGQTWRNAKRKGECPYVLRNEDR